jgi:hypothetical protein
MLRPLRKRNEVAWISGLTLLFLTLALMWLSISVPLSGGRDVGHEAPGDVPSPARAPIRAH